MPRLSCVIPAVGTTQDLETTLVSVLEKRPDDCEIIVVLNESYADPYGLKDEVRFVEMIGAVNGVLHDIGADELPIELVLNKVDAADETRRRALSNRYPDALQVSALTGEGLDDLRARIADRFADLFEPVRLLLPYQDGGKLNELYALGAPIEEREDTSEGVLVLARLPRREINRFARYLVGH